MKGICSLGRRRRSESQVTCKSPWRQHRTVTDKILKPKSLTPPWLLSTPHSSRSAQAINVYPAAWNPECFTPQKSQAPPTQVNRKQHLLPKVFVLLQEQFCSSVVHARPAFIRSKIQQNRTLMRIVNSLLLYSEHKHGSYAKHSLHFLPLRTVPHLCWSRHNLLDIFPYWSQQILPFSYCQEVCFGFVEFVRVILE